MKGETDESDASRYKRYEKTGFKIFYLVEDILHEVVMDQDNDVEIFSNQEFNANKGLDQLPKKKEVSSTSLNFSVTRRKSVCGRNLYVDLIIKGNHEEDSHEYVHGESTSHVSLNVNLGKIFKSSKLTTCGTSNFKGNKGSIPKTEKKNSAQLVAP
jgi:hypothetical protein